MKFAVCYFSALVLAALCAWIFGTALSSTYPNGIYVFPPESGAPAVASNAFHIGMGMGWFFSGLCLVVMALSVFSLNRIKQTVLQHLPAPFLSAALSCFVLLFLAIRLT